MNNSTHIVAVRFGRLDVQSYSPFTNAPTWKAAEFHEDAYAHYDRLDYDTV
jgi:hypothetical protein